MEKQILFHKYFFYICHKLNLLPILFIILTIWFGVSYSATNDSFCHLATHEVDKLVCHLSNQLNVPPVKIGQAMVLASIEITGTYCDFIFSDDFLEQQLILENDMEVRRSVEFFIRFYRDREPPGFNGDKKIFCKLHYAQFKKFYK